MTHLCHRSMLENSAGMFFLLSTNLLNIENHQPNPRNQRQNMSGGNKQIMFLNDYDLSPNNVHL